LEFVTSDAFLPSPARYVDRSADLGQKSSRIADTMPHRRRALRSPLVLSLLALPLLACSAGKDTDGGKVLPDGAVVKDTGGGDAGPDVELDLDTGAVDSSTASDVAPETGGGVQDAKPDVVADSCTDGGPKPGPGPYPHTCAPKTDNECDGKSDLKASLPNGANGNGFDDDCDGIVDEGCTCDTAHPPGTTKDCWLVPSSQSDAGGSAVGWCKQNSKGTMTCIQTGSGEFTGRTWDGVCRGAQLPFAEDACAAGDFDCDGANSNPVSLDCACKNVDVTCPTDPLVNAPYPVVTNLEQKKANPLDPSPTTPFIIDGAKWIGGGGASAATNWVWTVTGGDCDNILPHPTFAIYNGANANTATRIGAEKSNLGSSGKQKGLVTPAAPAQHQIWPAFSLSGDYVVKGEFDVYGVHYACTQKVQIRYPGVRAELCWDMEATAETQPGFGKISTADVDLHLGRLQGSTCTGKHGWFDSCGTAPSSDDCYFATDSGCVAGSVAGAPSPGWGYTASATEACHGWGSLRAAGAPCDNPRLDRDNISCGIAQTNPNAPKGATTLPNQVFCGPENINIDNPKANDQFLVGTHFYSGTTAHTHVNIYCNGERKLALGFDPTSTPPITKPYLTTGFNPGSSPAFVSGDMWEVARVTWKGGADPCTLEPIPSKAPKTDKDGNTNICVDTNAQNKASPTASDLWLFTPGGNPTSSTALGSFCWH
jgi:hypothetical protein